MKSVYDNVGECLGDEWIDLSAVQDDTKKAVLQIVCLDEAIGKLNDRDNRHHLGYFK